MNSILTMFLLYCLITILEIFVKTKKQPKNLKVEARFNVVCLFVCLFVFFKHIIFQCVAVWRECHHWVGFFDKDVLWLSRLPLMLERGECNEPFHHLLKRKQIILVCRACKHFLCVSQLAFLPLQTLRVSESRKF